MSRLPTMTASLPIVSLKKGEDRRLRAGHTWIFSNEIDTARNALAGFSPGQAVLLHDHAGRPLGTGYINPHTLICARLVSRDPQYTLNRSLLVHRLQVALALRDRLFAQPYYRLVYGDSDGLPGLVIDRYGAVLVGQISTAGMEILKEEIVAAVTKVLNPAGFVWRNDGSARALEGLQSYTEVVIGSPGEHLEVSENGCHFRVPALAGQKTGWFFDHRINRQRMTCYVARKRVLDLFSYAGAWGIQAARAGAQDVLCVDASSAALAAVVDNAAGNGVAERVRIREGDAFEVLKQLRLEREHFDVVIVDPPAFVRRKKDLDSGIEAYRRLNQAAMQLVAKDGILISASCSSHLARDTLRGLLLNSSRHLDRFLQVVEQGHQGPDHPIHPAIPETEYLKAFFCRLLPS
jgi:23S rRNA (cytosine1962-C5)-methyltransferase